MLGKILAILVPLGLAAGESFAQADTATPDMLCGAFAELPPEEQFRLLDGLDLNMGDPEVNRSLYHEVGAICATIPGMTIDGALQQAMSHT